MSKYNGGPDTWGASPEPQMEQEPTEEQIERRIESGAYCPRHRADWDGCDCAYTPQAEKLFGYPDFSAGSVKGIASRPARL